jgi:hypothetical protein
LFSQENVAEFINNAFEPVWESVRPVPVVRIDFGGGHILTRTLHGNILTSVCDADGRLLDALPGIYAADVYLDRLNQLRLLARYAQSFTGEERAAKFRDYHQRQADALQKQEQPEVFVEKRKAPPFTKRVIERPVELVLERPNPDQGAKKGPQPGPTPAAGTDVAGWKELAEDTRLNETTRRLQIHLLLRDAGLVRPEKVVKSIYKDVLLADLDDPYLGLGKVLFANYPFAGEDEKR